MLVLIGSQAQKFYSRLVGRKPADFDFIHLDSSTNKRVAGYFGEFSSADDGTNKEIYNYSIEHSKDIIKTPFGEAVIAPIEILKVLKLSSKKFLDKAKHEWDLQQLTDVTLSKDLAKLARKREEEIRVRVEGQKDEFFNKYEVPRFIDHDWMHELINPVPIYTKILVNAVDVSEEKFLALPLEEKRMLVREECMVLVLERELIPKAKKSPHMIKVLYKQYSRTETSTTPALRWLSRLSIVSKVKDHPPWLSNWTTENINYVTENFQTWWTEKLDRLPVEFWEKVLGD